MTALLCMTKLRQQLRQQLRTLISLNNVKSSTPYTGALLCVNEKKALFGSTSALGRNLCGSYHPSSIKYGNVFNAVEPAAKVYTCYSMAIER